MWRPAFKNMARTPVSRHLWRGGHRAARAAQLCSGGWIDDRRTPTHPGSCSLYR